MSTSRQESPFLVVFADLTRFGAQSQRLRDVELADTLDEYYRLVADAVTTAGGRPVKFIGDAALAVFPETGVDPGVSAVLDLKSAVDRLMATRGWDCRLVVKAHFGTVVAGPFGPRGSERFDVIGKTVNTAATLDASGVTLSVTAFRKLGPALRQRFKKHTPPITYIRREDSHHTVR
jgi:adenylate cyclase